MYTEQDLIGDAQRVAQWGTELRHWVEVGDAAQAAYLAKAIATVAARIAERDGRATQPRVDPT